MTRGAGIWAAGLAGSVAAHAAGFGLVMMAVQPEPVSDQPVPESRLDIEAWQVERTEAPEAQPDAEDAVTAEAQDERVSQGAVPLSKGRPLETAPDQLSASAAPLESATPLRDTGVQLAAATPIANALAASGAKSSPLETVSISAQNTVVDAAEPLPVSASAAFPASATLAVLRPAADPLPSAAPAAMPVMPDTARAPAAPVARPDIGRVPEATPDAAALALLTPPAERMTARLAFQGAGDGDIDPVSLAAFQSFMGAGDLEASGSSAGTVRDSVAGLLSSVPCSRIQVGFDPDTATLTVNGHVPKDDARAPVLDALRAQMGEDIALSDNLLILPRPQCGALTGIADVGLPQSTDQITNPLIVGPDAHARVFGFVEGDRLTLEMTAPDYNAFVYVDYFDADGQVQHLVPNEMSILRLSEAETRVTVGSDDDTLQIYIGPPFGQEIAVAFAASHRLYDTPRPIAEPAEPYLAFLRERVAEAREKEPDFKGEWVYFFVKTAAR